MSYDILIMWPCALYLYLLCYVPVNRLGFIISRRPHRDNSNFDNDKWVSLVHLEKNLGQKSESIKYRYRINLKQVYKWIVQSASDYMQSMSGLVPSGTTITVPIWRQLLMSISSIVAGYSLVRSSVKFIRYFTFRRNSCIREIALSLLDSRIISATYTQVYVVYESV